MSIDRDGVTSPWRGCASVWHSAKRRVRTGACPLTPGWTTERCWSGRPRCCRPAGRPTHAGASSRPSRRPSGPATPKRLARPCSVSAGCGSTSSAAPTSTRPTGRRSTGRILATTDPRLTARLRLRRAADARYGADGPKDDVRAALDELRRLGDPLALAHGLSLAAPHAARPARRDRAGRRARRAGRGGGPGRRPDWSSLLGLALDDDRRVPRRPSTDAMRSLQRLRVRVDELGHDADPLRHPDDRGRWRSSGPGVCRRWRRRSTSVRRSGLEVGERDADNWYAAAAARAALVPGPGDRARARRRRARRLTDAHPPQPGLPGHRRRAGRRGRRRRTRRGWRLAGVAPFDEPPHGLAPSSVWLGTMFEVVEAYDRLGGRERSRRSPTRRCSRSPTCR